MARKFDWTPHELLNYWTLMHTTNPTSLTDGAALFAALAHPARLAAFRYLVQAGQAGAVAGAIADISQLSPSALSFHLKELAAAGLVRSWREGRHVRYALQVARLQGLVAFLVEECCQGRPDLCGLTVADRPDGRAGTTGSTAEPAPAGA